MKQPALVILFETQTKTDANAENDARTEANTANGTETGSENETKSRDKKTARREVVSPSRSSKCRDWSCAIADSLARDLRA
jgi:hypothetical protein